MPPQTCPRPYAPLPTQPSPSRRVRAGAICFPGCTLASTPVGRRWPHWKRTTCALAFHGHTHVQQAWSYIDRRWQQTNGPAEFALECGTESDPARYLIGVGSAGEPQDGRALRYALYDDSAECVALVALDTTTW